MSTRSNTHTDQIINKIYNPVFKPSLNKKKYSNNSKQRPNTAAVVGIALGDEGKGRIVDNKISDFLSKKNISGVFVVRYQGGNNAGHTVEKDGKKIALHLVPSFVFHEKAKGIMDRGMAVNIEDLVTEINYVEDIVGSLKNRLFLSDDAILCTDLERAEEILNEIISDSSKGGTGRGIGPSYAHHYDKTGLRISDVLEEGWKKTLSERYENFSKILNSFDIKLSQLEVPDFEKTVKTGSSCKRKIGTKKEFIERVEYARDKIINKKIIKNTFDIHRRLAADLNLGIIFEGAQAAGLDSWTGTRPDVTSSNTTVFGIRDGTGFWLAEEIIEKIGILKIPYTSSVGSRKMPTHIDIPKTKDEKTNYSYDQKWALNIREKAHEYGTTTGRPRDINFIDIPFISYNIRMSGINSIITTHLDICSEMDVIKICTSYTDKNNSNIPYQPGLKYAKNLLPKYTELPGWDGDACHNAKNKTHLPDNAVRFLSILEEFLGINIAATTTGPSRNNFLKF